METGSESQRVSEVDVTSLLSEMQLDAAIRALKRPEGGVDSAAVRAMILGYETRASRMQAAGLLIKHLLAICAFLAESTKTSKSKSQMLRLVYNPLDSKIGDKSLEVI